MADRRINYEAALTVEQPLLKTSYEQLHKSFRGTRKYLEKELSLLSTADKNSADSAPTCIVRLTALKRKLVETQMEEQRCLKRCKARLDYLTDLHNFKSTDDSGYNAWTYTRLNRLLVDYLLRRGYFRTADGLVNAAHLEDLVDTDLFQGQRRIEESMRLSKSCTECLQWCAENRSNLKKNGSSLEFALRMQEFIEMVRRGENGEAIKYAQKFFVAWVDTNMMDIQKAMALLAFGPNTECSRYKKMFGQDRWTDLVQQFRQDSFALNNLTTQSILSIVLQAGLTALKTPFCYQPQNQNSNCPVCDSVMRELAQELPFSHHINSCVVCRISGAIMDEDNTPTVLPNGNVYSLNALTSMADLNQGKIVDPRTKQVFDMSQTKKAFLT